MLSKSQVFEMQIDLPIDYNRTLAPLNSMTYPEYAYSLAAPAEIYAESTTQFDIQPTVIHQVPTIEAIRLSDYCSWDCLQVKTSFDTAKCKIISSKQALRSPAIYKYDISSKIDELLNLLSTSADTSKPLIYKGIKNKYRAEGLRGSKSKYIGVTLNKNSWQALISVQKKKTYIGSFCEEIIAALAFDFYSISLHGLQALTNFDYTKQEIINMINNYKINENKFVPEEYFHDYSLIHEKQGHH